MTCNDKCIHFPVCEQKKFDFANIDECEYYQEEQPTFEWILVKERLPEEDGDYIVTFLWDDGEEEVGKSWYNTRIGFIYDHVIAWMPLPKTYKKGGAGE